MKKIWIVLAAMAMVLALGTAAYAASDDDKGFQQMLPMMKQAHPDVPDEKLQAMYNACHGDGKDMSGMMNGEMGGMMQNGMSDMMKNGGMSNMMGNGSMQNMMSKPDATIQ